MNLTGEQLKDTYGNLVTIGSVAGAPTTGTLQNGAGNDITTLDVAGTITIDGLISSQKLELSASEPALVSTGSTAKVYATNTSFDSINGSLVLQSRPVAGANVYVSTGSTPKTVAKFFDTGDISFRDTSNNEAFYWDASAVRLGIGTSSPTSALSIDTGTTGTIAQFRGADTDILNIDGDSNAITLDARNVASLNFEMQGSEAMRIDSSGRLLVGTETDPTIANNGGVSISPANNDRAILRLATTGSSELNLLDFINSNGIVGQVKTSSSDVLIDADSNLILETGSTERMRIDSSGKVGIGTTSPAEFLHIETATESPAILVKASGQTGSTSPTAELILSNGSLSSNDSAPKIIAYRTSDYSSAALRSSGLKFQTTNANSAVTAMTIDNSGNVGIGQISPSLLAFSSRELHVKGGTGTNESASFIAESAQSASGFLGGYYWVNGSATDEFQKRVGQITLTAGTNADESKMDFFVKQGAGNYSTAMTIDSSGNLDMSAGGGNIILDSGAGIDFSGTANSSGTMTSELLDDYEEGTWTPVYAPQTGSFTTMTMDVFGATYTKIGRQVTVGAFIRTSNVDATGASGNLVISGLPFARSANNRGAISVVLINNWSTVPDGGAVGTSEIALFKTNGTTESQVSDLTTGAISARNELLLTATYFV